MELKAKRVKKVYRGAKELSEDKSNIVNNSFQERGYIMLRPGERLTFGTGEKADKDSNIVPCKNIVEEKGLILSSTGTKRKKGDYIELSVFNPTKYMIKIELNEKLAEID